MNWLLTIRPLGRSHSGTAWARNGDVVRIPTLAVAWNAAEIAPGRFAVTTSRGFLVLDTTED